MRHAVVVGSGPNGLTAAVRLAQAGMRVRVLEAKDRIGGGTRTSELTGDGLLHDDCSAFHPTGITSPAFAALGLERFGLEWLWPEVEMAHPLDGGRAGILYRDLDRTAEGLGVDGAAWKRTLGPAAEGFAKIAGDVFGPILRIPRHPLTLARFGLVAAQPVTRLVRRWRTDEAQALFRGVAAHAFVPLSSLASSAVGVMLTAAGHAGGWPVAKGGSRAITDALAAALASYGGTIETGVEVTSLGALGNPDVVMLDVSPRAALDLLGHRMPKRIARAYRKYRYGPAAYKLDLAVRGDIPWANPEVGKAGTVHLGGSFDELAQAEAQTYAGRMPKRPFVLVGQQYVADPSRSRGDLNPVWVYAHVPAGYTGDATDAALAQIERFAPGFRSQIVSVHVRGPAAMQAYDANYLGGDIAVGDNRLPQLVFRPRIAFNPYATGVDGVYLCSSATPPGAGVHGMCGWHAATAPLRSFPRNAR